MSRRLLAVNPVAHPGGAETTCLRLLAGLRERGWTITATTPGAGPLADLIAQAGHGHATLPLGGIGRGEGLRALASLHAARGLAARHDAVLLNGAVCGRLLAALVPAVPSTRRSGGRVAARVVLHLHDIVARVSRLWRRADLIVGASGAVARSLGQLRVPVEVVYPPVEPDPAPAAPPWERRADAPVVGFVGRIEPRKGPLDLARALPALRGALPRARVVVLGDPPPYARDPGYERAVLEADGIEHHGWRPDATALMRHLDVVVLPSYREPFGTVLAEAMAVGTPVVATPVDGLPEVVRDGVSGRLVPPGDPVALAAAVVEVLARREEFGAAAQREARRFHTERHVERMERLLTA